MAVSPERLPGSLYRINEPLVTLRTDPDARALCSSEALYGEQLTILADLGAWCQVRLQKDGYEGFISSNHLDRESTADDTPSTHWISNRSTLLFSQPDLKSQLWLRLPFGAELTLTEVADSPFSQTACGHYVWKAHCLSLSENYPAPPLQLAQHVFLGSPYLWGGRSPAGIDCSALIQSLALSQGISIPRDSGDQERFLQTDVSPADYLPQDVVYWPGHSGILVSPSQVLHATAHTLSCVVEPLQAVIDRAGPASSAKRLFGQ